MIFAVTSYYDPHFTASSQSDREKRLPSVWWLIFAVAQFIAHTLDGCDGKQARRTNSRYWIYLIIYTEKFVPVPNKSVNTVSDLTHVDAQSIYLILEAQAEVFNSKRERLLFS